MVICTEKKTSEDSISVDNNCTGCYTFFPPVLLDDDLSFFGALAASSTISTELSLDLERFELVAVSLARSESLEVDPAGLEDDGRGLEGEEAACFANIDAIFPFLSEIGCESRISSPLLPRKRRNTDLDKLA